MSQVESLPQQESQIEQPVYQATITVLSDVPHPRNLRVDFEGPELPPAYNKRLTQKVELSFDSVSQASGKVTVIEVEMHKPGEIFAAADGNLGARNAEYKAVFTFAAMTEAEYTAKHIG